MAETQKTAEEIKAYENFKSGYEDFTRFVGSPDLRAAQKAAFIGDLEYVPQYDYVKLQHSIDEDSIRDKKTAIQEAIMELEVAKQNPDNNPAEIELFIKSHERRLSKMFLVEAARDLMAARDSAEADTLREAFMEMNDKVYGQMDVDMFMQLISNEVSRLKHFQPRGRQATLISGVMHEFYGRMSLEEAPEFAPFTPEEAKIFENAIQKRNAHELTVLPKDGPKDYNAQEVVAFGNDMLAVNGGADDGWSAEVDPTTKKASTRTTGGNLLMIFPPTTHGVAGKVRRKLIHEDFHRLKDQSGRDLGIEILRAGTANHFDVEEGMAVLRGAAAEGNFDNSSFESSRYGYMALGLALGLDGIPRDARETYNILWPMIAVKNAGEEGPIHEDDILKAKQSAYTEIEDIFRGTQFYQKGVVYMRKKMYLEGLMKNVRGIKKAIQQGNLDEFLDRSEEGRYDYTDPEESELAEQLIAEKLKETA